MSSAPPTAASARVTDGHRRLASLLVVGQLTLATTLLIGQVMVMAGVWAPAGALYVTTVLSVPFLLRHAVVAL